MPGRISRVSAPRRPESKVSTNAGQKGNRKRKDRNLHAYSIAEKTNPEKVKVRQYRLGEVEDNGPRRKKQRTHGEEEDGHDAQERQPSSSARRTQGKADLNGDYDALDAEGTESDSDGNVWHTGTVGEDEDSDVDSDEAFGSSDEERFEGFTFRGSSSGKGKRGGRKDRPKSTGSFDLNEDNILNEDDEDGESESESDFGEDGIDLAEMLDEGDSDDGRVPQKKPLQESMKKEAEDDDPSSFEDEDLIDEDEDQFDDDEEFSDSDGPSEYSDEDGDGKFRMSDDEAEDEDVGKQEQLQQMVSSLAGEDDGQSTKPSEPETRNEMLARALAALKTSSSVDPAFSRQVQKLSRSLQPSKQDGGKSVLVSAPLPKRQQDRIDRTAARGETNKTLDRWVDTVKHNRRADHLTFPLIDPEEQEAQGTSQLTSTGNAKPHTDLEHTIANILKESGLGPSGGRAEERQLQGFEELQTNKMPLDEVLARRAELRKQRELMFREEIKARRIKKIKSKAYRRVHRRDAQKAAQKERDLMAAAGFDPSEDEKEMNDRRRAEERMGGRHRESRWAKSVKQAGRAAWDDDARDGVTEMARRNEQLRRRVEGKPEEDDDGMQSDLSSEGEGSLYGDEDDETFERQRLERQLGKIDGVGSEEVPSGLSSLKFMQRAEASRKKQNEQDVARLRKDLAGEDSEADSEAEEPLDTAIGRRIFGPTVVATEPAKSQTKRADFEEGQSSDDDDSSNAPEDTTHLSNGLKDHAAPVTSSGNKSSPVQRPTASVSSGKLVPPKGAKVFGQQQRRKSTTTGASVHNEAEDEETQPRSQPAVEAPNMNGWTTVRISNKSPNGKVADTGSPEEEPEDPIVPSNLELVQAAFGGDDVEASFAAEKAEAAESEDEKVVDNALPGWGSWAGEGISKREQKRIAERNKGRFLTKVADGVKPSERKDRNMAKVIISEKKSKKNVKYLASALPHPFESRVQYERGIRQPIGPEWTTKETFQDATRPRVMVKPGRAIKPMEVPML